MTILHITVSIYSYMSVSIIYKYKKRKRKYVYISTPLILYIVTENSTLNLFTTQFTRVACKIITRISQEGN